MKKLYIQPEIICCVLQSKMMMALSGRTLSDPAIVDGSGNLNNDVKGLTDVNIWDDEW